LSGVIFLMALAIGLLILRVGLGLTIAAHGSQKLFGWFGGGGIEKTTAGMARQRFTPAWFWTWVAALGEFGGGLLLTLGLFSPLGGFGVLGAMLVAIVASHLHKGFWNRNGGVEFPLMIALPALALTLTGPGAISIDNLFKIALPEPQSWIVFAIGTLLTVTAALKSRTLATPAASEGVGAV
jgi:putative oxidoreductase